MSALQDLKQEIRDGDYDDSFDVLMDGLYKSIRMRLKRLHEKAAEELAVGDRVQVAHGPFKPRYMHGAIGTIDSLEDDMVWIKLDQPIIRSTKTIGKVGVKASWVDLLDAS